MEKGLIIKSISGEYTVYSDNQEIIVCKPRGIFRLDDQSPKVGDRVVFHKQERTITEIYPRKNDLVRPVIANVDKVFLLFSLKEPELNLHLLDRMLAIINYADVETVLVFTKQDIADLSEYQKIIGYYRKIGYSVILTSKENPQKERLIGEIDHNISVFAGQSGVGKSTLLNLLDVKLNIKTAEISKALGRGKHTTRHVELIPIRQGWIADTPGFGIADFFEIDVQTLSHTFVEFFKYSNQCRFNGCTHINEPGCKIKEMVQSGEILASRHENYTAFVKEIEETRKNKY